MKALKSAQDVDISYLQERLDFDEVLEALGIEVSHELGSWIMCHCPNTANHSNGDQNPSFGFNIDEMSYNCFVCGGGTLLKLVKDQLNLSDQEAEWFLQQLSTFEPTGAKSLVDKVTSILHPVKDMTVMPSFLNSIYGPYLEGNIELRNQFLLSRKIDLDIAAEVKIGFDPEHYGITIPHWFDGKLRGWQTRHLLEEGTKWYCEVCKEKAAKYTNTANFPKKQTLYLYDMAIGVQITVVESPLSALYLWSMGIPNVVATFGSFSLEQSQLLKKFPKVRIWPDNDPAGVKNLYRILDDLSQATDVTVIPLVDKPKGDPGDVFSEHLFDYLHSAYSPAILPMFKGKLPTLEQVQPYI